MTPLAQDLFAQARELPAAERDVFLAQACGDDAELRLEVQRLLVDAERADSFFGDDTTLGAEAFRDIDGMDLDATIAATMGPAAGIPAEASPANPAAAVPFIFGRRIAQGGMGAILETEDCKLGRTIAAKVMLLDQDASEDMRQRFIQEAAVLAKLAHPNIVPVYDLGHDERGQLYYTMKLVKGRTLQDILNDLRHERPEALREFTLERLLTIFRKVADALAFAHSKGIIHRDLKPENIMVGEFGEVLLMDWGLAKMTNVECGMTDDGAQAANDPHSSFDIRNSSLSGSLTNTLQGAVMGTPRYMSPEQAMGRIDELDARSDIFSLGGILYAILTLRPPVEGKTVQEVLTKVRSASITPPTTFGTTTSGAAAEAKGAVLEAKQIKPLPHIPAGRVPGALSAVAMKALTLDKARRYQDVAAFSADIEAYQTGFATTAEQAGLAKQLVLLIKRHKSVFTTAAAAWLLITALAVWFVFNLRTSEKAAREAEAVAEEKSEAARVALARSQTSLAEAAYREFDGIAMLVALRGVPEDLRDGDWRYLHARADNSQTVLTFPNGQTLTAVAPHPQKPGIFAGALSGNKFVFVDALSGQRVFEFPCTERQQRNSNCRALDFSPDGTRLIAGKLGAGGVAIYDTATGKPLVEWDANEVEQVSFSRDGTKTLQVANGLSVHDAASGRELWRGKDALCALFTPDGQVLVPNAGQVRLLDGTTGALVKNLAALRDSVTDLALSPDGAVLYLGSQDGVVRGMKLADGVITFEQRLTAGRGYPRLALSSDGRHLLAAMTLPGQGRVARVWDTSTGVILQTLMGGTGRVDGVAMHPLTAEAIISGPVTRTWALATRTVESKLRSPSSSSVFWGAEDVFIAGSQPVKLGGDGRWSNLTLPMPPECQGSQLVDAVGEIATFGKRGLAAPIAIFRKTADGIALLHTVRPKGTFRFSLSPDGRRLAILANNNESNSPLEVFDTASGQRLCEADAKLLRNIQHICWIGADRIVGIGRRGSGPNDSEEHILVWDAKTGAILRDVRNPAVADVLTAAPDGRTFAEGCRDKRVRIRDAETLAVIREFRAHDGTITALAFHPTQPVLASGSTDLTVRLWSLEDGSLIEEIRPSKDAPFRLSFSPGGTRLASTDRSDTTGTATLFNLAEPPLGKFTRGSSKRTTVEVSNFPAPSKTTKNAPPVAIKPPVPKDADGWEDHLSALAPELVAQTGKGWSLKDGELFSPDTEFATLPLLGDFSGTSYRLRVKLRQSGVKRGFHFTLPVADRMCGFSLDGRSDADIYTGIGLVNGKHARELLGVVKGMLINDNEPHDLELTVRLDGANATITTALDGKPVYEWTGPSAALSQHQPWATTEPGALALGTSTDGWAVSEVKLKRLEAPRTLAPVAAPQPTLAETLSRAGKYAEAALATREFITSRGTELESGTGSGATIQHMILATTLLAAGDRDGYRAALAEVTGRFRSTTDPYQAENIAKTCLLAPDSGVQPATLAAFVTAAQPFLEQPKMVFWAQLLNALAEYRLGHWDAAADWAAKMRANPNAPERGTAAAAAILAMAEHQREQPTEAAKALEAAQTAIAANWPAGTDVSWHNWLIADLLAKEAEALIERKD